MDKKIKKYQSILEKYLQEEANDKIIPGIEFQVITDKVHHQYQLVETGWYKRHYIHSVLFHFSIKENGRVWLLINNTDILVGDELMKRGIPASDIVIGFHPENVRQFTGFATA